MKSFISALYWRLGHVFGIDDKDILELKQRTPDDIEQARRVFAHLKRLQDEWRDMGVTAEEVRGWIREGRR